MSESYVATHHTLEACPVCDGRNLSVLEEPKDVHAFITTGSEFAFHIGLSCCETCGFIFVNPRSTQAEMSKYYGMQARNPRDWSNLDKPYADLIDFQTRFIRKLWKPAGRQRILDIGSAEGLFLNRLAAECEEPPLLEGIEPGARYAAAARALMPDAVIHEEILESATLPERSYDLVTIRHVLEHLLDPVAAVKIIRPLVKPEGLLHIEVPDVTDVPATISPFLHYEHMNSFTPDTLRLTLERGGFEILLHESANDNPEGSGFAYPVQRVLATPTEGRDWLSAINPSAALESKASYRSYEDRYRTFLSGRMTEVRKRIRALAGAGKTLGVFGAGPHTYELFRALDLDPKDFVLAFDNNPHKHGKLMRGIEIVKPTRDAMSAIDAVLISSAQFEPVIFEQVEGFGLPQLEVLRLYNDA